MGIRPREDPEGGNCVHHLRLVGVENGEGETRRQSLDQKTLGNQAPVWKPERNVGYAQNGLQTQLLPDGPNSPQGFRGLLLLGGHREGETVYPHVLPRDAEGQSGVQDFPRNGETVLRRLGNAPLVQRQAHNAGPVFFHDGQNPR